MSFKIIADECVHRDIVQAIRDNGYEVKYISEVSPGISDHQIVKLVSETSAILITEDSDFGEWVFVHGYTNIGVIFLRYPINELQAIKHATLKVIRKYENDLFKKFIVITSKKLRIREI